MERIDYIRYCKDEKYRQSIIAQARHGLALKFRECWKRVKENKIRNGGVYIPEK